MSDLSKSINQTMPFSIYEVWDIDGKTYGRKYEDHEFRDIESGFLVVYKFVGREATYWIATNDESVYRIEALDFARRVHEGKFRILNVDLLGLRR